MSVLVALLVSLLALVQVSWTMPAPDAAAEPIDNITLKRYLVYRKLIAPELARRFQKTTLNTVTVRRRPARNGPGPLRKLNG